MRKNKIVVMDESTSSFDLETQNYIDELIKTEFKKSTVITIANQLNNVMGYDKVLLLDWGHLVEFGTPKELLAWKDSVFSGLVQTFKEI